MICEHFDCVISQELKLIDLNNDGIQGLMKFNNSKKQQMEIAFDNFLVQTNDYSMITKFHSYMWHYKALRVHFKILEVISTVCNHGFIAYDMCSNHYKVCCQHISAY